MAAKVYEIAFEIAGKMKGEFAKTFKHASTAVKSFHSQLNNLNKQAADMDKIVRLRKEVGNSAREYAQARMKVAELGRQISATQQPTQKMIAEFNRAKASVEKVKVSLDKKRLALKSVEDAAGTTGQSLKTLIARQNELQKSADRARRSQERLAKATELQSKLKSNAMSSAGSLAGMAVAATGTVALPVKQAMAMEDAMAEVRKVTDYTPEGLEKARQELELMSTRIPFAADGLAQIMASAAQSGVAQKDLISFTEQAAKMGVAFDITAEEAGEMMAKWQSGMGLTLEQTYSLADATNALSNSNAATASQIGEVLKRYGSLGKVAGLSEKQTAAFAASVVASGAESEVAATGIKAFMRAMSKGGSMSTKQAAAFGNVGLDPKQLQKNLQKDAPAAIIQTLEAIQKKIPKEQWNQYLSVMFGEEASVAVGPMMQNLDGLKANFELVGKEAGYSGSMLKEFESRSATTSNALTLAKNAATYAARAIGQPLLEPMKKAAAAFVENAVAVGDWIKNNQKLVMTGLKVAGVIAAGVTAFHAIRIAMLFTVSPLISLYKGYQNVKKAIMLVRSSTILTTIAMKAQRVAMVAAQVVMKGMRAAMLLLNSAMLANPIGLVIAALAGLIAIGVLVYKNWDKIKAKAVELWSAFSSKFPGMAAIFKSAFNNIKNIAMNVWNVFKNIIGFVKNVFTGQWSAAWQNVKKIFGSAFSALVGLAKAPINTVIGLINKMIGGLNSLSFSVPNWVPGIGGKKIGFNVGKIPQLADGGIATGPTMAMIGEGREDEAVLPLSKLKSMLGGTGGGGMTVNFSPTINISGGSSDAYAGVKRGLEEGQNNLKRELERLMANQRRLSFA